MQVKITLSTAVRSVSIDVPTLEKLADIWSTLQMGVNEGNDFDTSLQLQEAIESFLPADHNQRDKRWAV